MDEQDSFSVSIKNTDVLYCDVSSNPFLQYSRHSLCQYETDRVGNVLHCKGLQHLGDFCEKMACARGYKCDKSYCISLSKVCDGVADCPSKDDEMFCDGVLCPEMLRCYNSSVCVPPWEVCDGTVHCKTLGEDELYCNNTCPKGCSCKGLVVDCSHLSQTFDSKIVGFKDFKAFYLSFTNSSNALPISAQAQSHVSLSYLTITHCSLSQLQVGQLKFLKHLDVSYNSLSRLYNETLISKYLLYLYL